MKSIYNRYRMGGMVEFQVDRGPLWKIEKMIIWPGDRRFRRIQGDLAREMVKSQ